MTRPAAARHAGAVERPAPRTLGVPLLSVALSAALTLAGAAWAQMRVRVEVPFGASVGIASSASATAAEASLVAGVAIDAELRFDPVTATLRLQPSLTAFDGAAAVQAARAGRTSPSWEPGLREAYLLVREGPVDFSAGYRRLALETARLSVPFQVDRDLADGGRQGLPGARASVYVGPLRVRGALLERSGSLGAAFSVRADLTSAQLEGHLVYLDHLALGVGASGTAGTTVVYGEGWLLAEPWRGRGALGASGYLGDALWTAEAAFAPPAGAATAPAVPQLLGQLSVPVGDDGSLELVAGVSLVDSLLAPGTSRLAGLAALTWTAGDPDVRFELGPSLRTGELGTHYAVNVRLTAVTGF